MSKTRGVVPALAAALVAHIPCCLPTLLLALGGAASSGAVSGLSWVHALDPYRPYLLTFSFGSLAFAFWFAYKPVAKYSCENHSAADHRQERRVKIITVWLIAAMVVGISLIPHHDEPSPGQARLSQAK